MPIRCKFSLDEQKNDDDKGELKTFTFHAVYHGDDPEHENSKYWKWTPFGQLILGTVNANVLEELQVGKEYYIDITEAPSS